jgi:hypothetical protein
MKKINKRLSLSKETLRNLSERELTGVAGGATTTCSGTTSSCTYDSCNTCECTSPCTTWGCSDGC